MMQSLLRWRGRTQAFIELVDGLSLTMVRIPAGEFVMGSSADEVDQRLPFAVEAPQHRVQLEELLMAQTPITQAQWRVVAGWEPQARDLNPEPASHPSKIQPASASNSPASTTGFVDWTGRGHRGMRESVQESLRQNDQRPVEQVSWHDAIEFCARLSQRTGRRYTLPSEAQWEYACRAGCSTPFCFGPKLTPELANYASDVSNDPTKGSNYVSEWESDAGPVSDGGRSTGEHRHQTTAVASFPANAWGLYDMHGNVYEWCLDHWHSSYADAPVDGSAWLVSGAEDSSHSRLLRGGSCFSQPDRCRCSRRDHDRPDSISPAIGFRVVCLPPGASS